MKLMIASDLHGSAHFVAQLLEAFRREQPDKLLLLGDLLYHGARNALPEGYETISATEQLNSIKDKLLCVRGNCDSDVDQMVLDFPIQADYCLLDLDGHTVFATHGHLYDESAPPKLNQGDILLCGHTHVPALRDHGNFLYMNPGSVSIPKEGSTNSYMTYEKGLFAWKNLAGEVYLDHRM